MIDFSEEPRRMVVNLDRFYASRDRIEAQIALIKALEHAAERIASRVGPFYVNRH